MALRTKPEVVCLSAVFVSPLHPATHWRIVPNANGKEDARSQRVARGHLPGARSPGAPTGVLVQDL